MSLPNINTVETKRQAQITRKFTIDFNFVYGDNLINEDGKKNDCGNQRLLRSNVERCRW
jgi:hypothetical protein